MADAAVEFMLEKLDELLLYNAKLISNVKDQVEGLIRDLTMLKAITADSAVGHSEHALVLKEMMSSIRATTLDAEDAFDAFVVDAAVQKGRSKIRNMFHIFNNRAKLRDAALMVKSRKKEAKRTCDKLFGFEALPRGVELGRRSGVSMDKKAPVVEDHDNVVGFDHEATTLIDWLTGETEDLRVILIIGMGGLGKTTLAKKVYSDPRVTNGFSTHAWIYLSKNYSRKDVFLSILSCVTQVTSDMSSMSDERLAEEVCHQLFTKYLIVVDDVWEKEDWDDVKMVFPNLKNGSRVLLTSRNRNVAAHADPHSPPHDLCFLDPDVSWELLQKKVFGQGKCNPDLEVIGKEIAAKCDGLPLTVVVISRILENKTADWWHRAAENFESFIFSNANDCMEVLALSFYHLLPQLKASFLYCGLLQKGDGIPVWKLIRLWIAEGFIKKIGDVCLEDIAEEQLEDLVAKNLVLVVQGSFSGRIKTCRIHDMFRKLCLREALAENFFSEITQQKSVSSSQSWAPNLNRRLCIHSGISEYISSKPFGPSIRSFLCFASEVVELPRENVAYLLQAFKLLTVYDIQPIHFPQFPNKIVQLVHLRYVAISGELTILPASMSNLWNLQTLIVKTTSRTIDIQADIWIMLQLRHVHTTGASQLHVPISNKVKDHESSLQTLSTITPESCAENVLGRTPYLRKLGIRGKLAVLVEEKRGTSLFDNLTKLEYLVTLKLLNEVSPHPPYEPKLHGLPQWHKFPRNLKRITLANTFLDWEQMSELGMLLQLEVLKLKDNAFTGTRWSPHDGGFRKLKVLQIGKTDLVYWEATRYHFPRLQHIVLRGCGSLEAIPSGLGEVKTLQTMILYQSSLSAAASAWKILEQQKKSKVYNGLKVHVPCLGSSTRAPVQGRYCIE